MTGEVGLAPEVAQGFSLDGRVAVITGAGSGLGRETARLFALAGARVVLADIDEQGLAASAEALRTGSALTRKVDVSSREELGALADWALHEAGGLDVWVNGAGISYLHSLLESDPARAEHTVAVNMMGAYWGCVSAARVMGGRGGGAIINISSGGGSKPLPGIGIYGMTKAAVNSLTWTSAAEFGPMGIRVNAVAPGWIETPMSRDLFRDETGRISEERKEAVRREMAAKSPLGRLGAPSDIAFALLYLASDASRFVTGQVLAVNGGESM
ncbi:SDR family NAD(P)-dependent oxidoreductase [Novosphingobium album (ex Hu et al. 2023)]|uniref:SDR family oxidoreductase n=1 Tax=Novosphingobium album (ex Hu et al. 2023) TaxID=2930093 RepID=A0ABT0B756_9SPHN|nr:SDR family oxidoreductase [Novosphingobium album (ex Hu et al. 2023)]MCJ2180857.1 SDR family oxidoreductase [Novosphingobium album (ex Hu et al. 2023)]